jgi:hypothetical protein
MSIPSLAIPHAQRKPLSVPQANDLVVDSIAWHWERFGQALMVAEHHLRAVERMEAAGYRPAEYAAGGADGQPD